MSKNKNRQWNQNNRISRNCSYEIGIKVTMIKLFQKINEKMNNLPASSAGGTGSIPGWVTKILYAKEK